MVDIALSMGRLGLAFFLVFLNGFFVASEFALVRIRSATVETLVEANRTGSGALQRAVDNLDDYLATTQLGITIASLGLGWVGEPAVAALLEPVLEPVLPASLLHFVAFVLGFGFITFLHVVFGELAPKTIAIQRAEKMALFVAPPMRLCYLVLYPGIVVFNGTANAFTGLLGVESAGEAKETMSEEEILLILARSRQQGTVDREEAEMIGRVFELDDTTAHDVMTPRPDVQRVGPDATLADLRERVAENGYTRYPVIDLESDRVHGFVDVKDLLTASTDGSDPAELLTARDLAREMVIVPESTPVDELLGRFQTEQTQMAAVIDEFGALEGIVTVEDVLEEVVGEIHDTFDSPATDPAIDRLSDDTFSLDASASARRVIEALDVEESPDDSGSIGGLVLDEFGRVPSEGDHVTLRGYEFEVTAMDGSRITRLVARRQDDDADGGVST